MTPMIRSISIVIPAFNEEKRLPPTLYEMDAYLRKQAERYEIIIVDDGSRDRTAGVIRDLSEQIPALKLFCNDTNRGKGFSVRKGVLHSQYDLILMSDADLSTPIEEVERLLPWLEKRHDIVIGSRGLKDSEIVIRQPWHREKMGKTFNLLVRAIVMRGVKDTQCGFKLFRGHVAREIFAKSRIPGFSFDIEILFIAKILGYNIKEVPVRWLNSPESKVRILMDPAMMFADLLRIRLNGLSGRYRK